jgi:hypothetical protein
MAEDSRHETQRGERMADSPEAQPTDMTDEEFEALAAETERLYRDDPAFRAYVIRAWDTADDRSDGWFSD